MTVDDLWEHLNPHYGVILVLADPGSPTTLGLTVCASTGVTPELPLVNLDVQLESGDGSQPQGAKASCCYSLLCLRVCYFE